MITPYHMQPQKKDWDAAADKLAFPRGMHMAVPDLLVHILIIIIYQLGRQNICSTHTKNLSA